MLAMQIIVMSVRSCYANLIDAKLDKHTAWKLLKSFSRSSIRKARRLGRLVAAPQVAVTAARTQLLSTVASFTVMQTWDTVNLVQTLCFTRQAPPSSLSSEPRDSRAIWKRWGVVTATVTITRTPRPHQTTALALYMMMTTTMRI